MSSANSNESESISNNVLVNEVSSEIIKKTPLLRGLSHLIAFPLSILFGLRLILSTNDSKARSSATIFTLSLAMLFGASALFHRSSSTYKYRKFLHKLDHSAIFILIAGTYTSLCTLALGTESLDYLLAFVWTGAIAGILKTFFLPRHRTITVLLYLTLGWSILPFGREIVQSIGSDAATFILYGGICYSVGALIYALKWPDPWPHLFGFHEIFHALVITASIFHYTSLTILIQTRV